MAEEAHTQEAWNPSWLTSKLALLTISFSRKLLDYACVQGTGETSARVIGSCLGFHLGMLVYIDIINPEMEVILKGHLIHSPCLKLP